MSPTIHGLLQDAMKGFVIVGFSKIGILACVRFKE